MQEDRVDASTASVPVGLFKAAARNLGWLLASRGVLAVLSLFYLGFATRSLGVVDFGRFALITGAAQALATLVAFQTWQIIVQYGVEPLQRGDSAALARLLRGSLALDAISAIAGVLLSIAILLLFGDRLGIPPQLMNDTLLFAVVQLVTIRSTPLGILRLRDRFSLAALADSMTPVVRFVGAVLAMVLDPTIHGFLIAWGAAELATAAAYWGLIACNDDWRLLRGGRIDTAQLRAENPGIVRFALSTNASATLGLSSKQIPLLMVGATIGPAAAGAFRVAAQVAQSLAKLSQLLSRAVFPEMVRAVRTAERAAIARMMGRMVLGSICAAVVILAVVAVAGRSVLGLIGGHAFEHAYPVLLWMAGAGCLDLAMVGADTMLTALRRAGTVFAIRAAGAVLLLVAAVLLLSVYGATGVAIGVFAGSTAVAAMFAFTVLRMAHRP